MRVGPKMLNAREYILRNPGCAILPIARCIGPSVKYGYNSVHRAINADLIYARTKNGIYACFASRDQWQAYPVRTGKK